MSLSTRVRLEHELIAVDHDGHVDLMLELDAPTRDPGEHVRPSANLALVVDRSGSMAGRKIRTVLGALAWLAGRLEAQDRAALVTFASEAHLLAPLGPARALKSALTGVRVEGTTNLSGGLLLGLEQLEAAPSGEPRTLLLLTDGLANVGITDPDTLVALAAGAAQRGVRISTIGLGDEFSEDLLRAIADAGRGDAHYAETAEAAPGIFGVEVHGLTEIVAQNLSVEVRPGAEVVSVDILNDFPVVPVAGGVRLELGDVYAGDLRRLVLRLAVPGLRRLGVRSVGALVIRHTAVTATPEAHTVNLPIAVNLVSAAEAASKAPDLAVTAEVQSLLADRAREEAVRAADRGDFHGAQGLLFGSAARLSALASESSEAAWLAAKSRELLEERDRFAAERYDTVSRKTSSYRAHQSKRRRHRPE